MSQGEENHFFGGHLSADSLRDQVPQTKVFGMDHYRYGEEFEGQSDMDVIG